MKAIITIFVLLASLNVYSAASVNAKVSGDYSSIRALGMGNAFTAVADDYSLIFYNPAGFARKKHNEFQFTLVGAGVSGKTTTIANDITKASETTGTDSDKANAISTALEKYYGQSLGGKLQAAELFWIRNGWGVALLPMDLTIDMAVQKQLGPALDLNVKGDSTIAFGMGFELAKNIDVGFTAKYLHRVAISEVVPAFELATNSNVLSEKRFKEGTNADFDIGILWKPSWFNSKTEETKSEDKKSEVREPQAEEAAAEAQLAEAAKELDKKSDSEEVGTEDEKKLEAKKIETVLAEDEGSYPLTFGFVVHNVIGNGFTLTKQINKSATEAPKKLYRVIDIGTQYLLREGEDFNIRVMLDFQNLLHPEVDSAKMLHAGLEFDYSPSTWFKTQIRGGYNQGYATAGVSLLFAVINIEVATYGEEVGTASTKLENRVLAAKLGMNF